MFISYRKRSFVGIGSTPPLVSQVWEERGMSSSTKPAQIARDGRLRRAPIGLALSSVRGALPIPPREAGAVAERRTIDHGAGRDSVPSGGPEQHCGRTLRRSGTPRAWGTIDSEVPRYDNNMRVLVAEPIHV
jgi:hypothetical protein